GPDGGRGLANRDAHVDDPRRGLRRPLHQRHHAPAPLTRASLAQVAPIAAGPRPSRASTTRRACTAWATSCTRTKSAPWPAAKLTAPTVAASRSAAASTPASTPRKRLRLGP